ncbi:MAG: regulatory protein RecX [Candidatus Fermentibacteria bacterium]
MELHAGSIVLTDEIEKAAFQDQLPIARRDAERYLSLSERTSHQLRSYLSGRKYLEKVADELLLWACGCGLVDDRRYASVYVRSHSGKSPMGNFRLRMELKKRGIPDRVTDDVLAERDEHDLYRSLVKTVKNKYGYLERQKGLRRAKGYLQRRGFQYDLISSVIDEVFRDSEEHTD